MNASLIPSVTASCEGARPESMAWVLSDAVTPSAAIPTAVPSRAAEFRIPDGDPELDRPASPMTGKVESHSRFDT